MMQRTESAKELKIIGNQIYHGQTEQPTKVNQRARSIIDMLRIGYIWLTQTSHGKNKVRFTQYLWCPNLRQILTTRMSSIQQRNISKYNVPKNLFECLKNEFIKIHNSSNQAIQIYITIHKSKCICLHLLIFD